MDDRNPSKKQEQSIFGKHLLIPGLPNDFALMCLARLSLRDRARCMRVSKAFYKVLSDGDLIDRVCEHHGIPSKHTRIFLCLGKEEECYQFGLYLRCSLMWLTINPHTQKWDVIYNLPWFGTDALGRNIRLVAGPHPGQILIHGLINSNPRYGCPWRQTSHVWSLDLYRNHIQKLIIKTRSYRTGFAWANMNGNVYVAAGRKFCDFNGETDRLLFNARYYCATENVCSVFPSYNDKDYDYDDDDDDDEENDDNDEGNYYDHNYDVDDYLGCGNWHNISDINEPREFCASFTMNGHFYLLGGMSELNDDSEFSTSGEFYDPHTDKWKLIPNMWPYIGHEQTPPAVAVINNQLYGIKPFTTEIIQYNASLNSWTKFADLPETCSIFNEIQLVGVNDELWVFAHEEGKFIVLSCSPCSENTSVMWKELFMNFLQGHSLLDCVVIEV